MTVFVGIDIAAKSFDLVIRKVGQNAKAEQFPQSLQGHDSAIKRLVKARPVLIVMEATGIYYLDLAVALAKAGLAVAVINPKSFKHFAAMKLKGSKTDPVDAALLAEYAESMRPKAWTPPNTKRLGLRDIGRQINRLTGVRAQAKNRLHALQAKQDTLTMLIEDELEGIAMLDHRLERLTQAALALIAECPTLSQHLENLLTAKGISYNSAIAILGELCVLPADMKACQVSRFAGLSVDLNQSGTSVRGPGRLSKAGNAYLRASLYMPALSATTHDPRVRAFRDALVNRGKKKIQAQCAVMRKYLTGIWACIQTNTPFDSTKLFSEQHVQA
jgi:transposase